MTETKTRTRTCDQCGADLTQTDRAYVWHYVLSGEFTPSTSYIGYDPHPTPPEDSHLCDHECLARFVAAAFGGTVSHEMFDAGAGVLKEAAVNQDFIARRKLAIAVFDAMWKMRPTRSGAQERSELPGDVDVTSP